MPPQLYSREPTQRTVFIPAHRPNQLHTNTSSTQLSHLQCQIHHYLVPHFQVQSMQSLHCGLQLAATHRHKPMRFAADWWTYQHSLKLGSMWEKVSSMHSKPTDRIQSSLRSRMMMALPHQPSVCATTNSSNTVALMVSQLIPFPGIYSRQSAP